MVSADTLGDEPYIAALLPMVTSLEDEGSASLARTLIDCIIKADDVCCSSVIADFKQ